MASVGSGDAFFTLTTFVDSHHIQVVWMSETPALARAYRSTKPGVSEFRRTVNLAGECPFYGVRFCGICASWGIPHVRSVQDEGGESHVHDGNVATMNETDFRFNDGCDRISTGSSESQGPLSNASGMQPVLASQPETSETLQVPSC